MRNRIRLGLELLESRLVPSWASLPSLLTPRAGLAAATGLDGRIYAIGGEDAFGVPLNVVEIYNPSTNTWSAGPPMPTARTNLAASTGLDGLIYAVGGSDDERFPLDELEVYNPATNGWTSLTTMPTAREGLSLVTAPDGRLFAIGGVEREGGDEGPSTTSAILEAYTPLTNTWTAAAALPFDGEVAAAMGSDGRLYAMADRTMAAYGLSSNSWTLVAGPPFGQYVPQAAAGRDGQIYALGGQLGSSLESYDPNTNTWMIQASSNSMPSDRIAFGVATALDGRVVTMGGESDSGVVAIVEAFTPDSPGTLNQRFVSQVYRDLLEREADPNGLSFWAGRLDQGATRVTVITNIQASQEYRNLLVTDLYIDILARQPDPSGLLFWSGLLAQGRTRHDVQAGLYGSLEFSSRLAGSENFIVYLYNRLLDRQASFAEISIWQNGLNNGRTRQQVAHDILGSREAETIEVQDFYAEILRRDADPSGLNTFVDSLQRGLSSEMVLASLASSSEYLGRV